MEPIEIFGAIVGVLGLVSFIVLMFFMFASCDKTEQKKRELMEEVTRYYKHRNEQFKESEEKE